MILLFISLLFGKSGCLHVCTLNYNLSGLWFSEILLALTLNPKCLSNKPLSLTLHVGLDLKDM